MVFILRCLFYDVYFMVFIMMVCMLDAIVPRPEPGRTSVLLMAAQLTLNIEVYARIVRTIMLR